MEFRPTDLPGVIVVEPDVFRDDRGFFLEIYHERKYREGGIDAVFVQDNHSRSKRGVLRGLHGQRVRSQGKLVRAISGSIFDVAVDVRRGSPTFAHWFGVELSGENFRQLYVPPDFLHGFVVLSEQAEVHYKCSELYDPSDEIGVRWNDDAIGVDWPIADPQVVGKDATAPRLRDVMDQLPSYGEG